MGIPLNLDFTMGVAKPIDSRFVMTKAEMLAANDAVMPPVYGCWCSEDGKPYIYNKNYTIDPTTGKFRKTPDAQDLVDISLQNAAFSQYSSAFADIYAKLNTIQDSMKANKDEKIVTAGAFSEGVWKTDFLPEHERSYFCQKVSLGYEASYVDGQDTDTIKVNGQSISVENGDGDEEKLIRVEVENGSINVYVGGDLAGNVADSIILTVEIDCSGSNPAITLGVSCEYSFVDYLDVKVTSKNGYAISETYDGAIEYWERKVVRGGGPKFTDCAHSFSGHHTRAVYATGNLTGSLYYFFAVAWNDSYYNETQAGREVDYSVDREGVIEYVYCSGWDFSNNTNLKQVFIFSGNANVNNLYKFNRDYVDNHLKKMDFSNMKFPKTIDSETYLNLLSVYSNKTVGDLSFLGNTLKIYPKGSRIGFASLYCIETLGDLSGWDVTNFVRFDEMFSYCMYLSFIGDIGKWKIGHGNTTNATTVVKNFFRFCFNLKGISSGISDWDMSKSKKLNGIFEGAFGIGDNTLVNLWKWDVGGVDNFGEMFAYMIPDVTNTVTKSYIPDNVKRWPYIVEEYTDEQTTDERKKELELELLELNRNAIIEKRTNLSFVENWDMHSATQLRDMFSFNPYLEDIGDLRGWQLDGSLTWTALGCSRMIAYCPSLATLKMPPIPRGVNVSDFAKGCTALANVEVNALNVEAISFEDCPLTKQSVLNLVNAATADVTITLSASVYAAMSVDADVTAAIQAKAGSNINVVLASNE